MHGHSRPVLRFRVPVPVPGLVRLPGPWAKGQIKLLGFAFRDAQDSNKANRIPPPGRRLSEQRHAWHGHVVAILLDFVSDHLVTHQSSDAQSTIIILAMHIAA
jgi:hypothetical protein